MLSLIFYLFFIVFPPLPPPPPSHYSFFFSLLFEGEVARKSSVISFPFLLLLLSDLPEEGGSFLVLAETKKTLLRSLSEACVVAYLPVLSACPTHFIIGRKKDSEAYDNLFDLFFPSFILFPARNGMKFPSPQAWFCYWRQRFHSDEHDSVFRTIIAQRS